MALKKLFRFLLGIQVALGIGLVILTLFLFFTQKDLNKSQLVHFRSYLLADELRQSSDDLTRMARVYVVTGNVEFEEKYWTILDIRNGKSPRPVNYNRIYWDFVIATGQKPRLDSEALSLHELMLKEGFTKAEFEKLALAQKNSDGLVKTEMIAMNAIKGVFDDGSGNFTIKKKPDRAMAIRIMNDKAYFKTKAEIMKPIDEFYAMFDERTTGDVRVYEQRAMNLLWSLGALIIIIMGMFGYSFVVIQRQITERMEAEKSLSKSETQFRTLFENASDGIIFLSPKTQIVKTNNSFAKMHGYSVEEMNNIKLQDLDVEDLSKLIPERKKQIENGEDLRFEVKHFHKQRHIIDLEVVTSRIHLGEENLIVAFHRDITARKQAEKKLRMFEQIFKSANDVINVADLNDNIVFVNPAFCKTYGYTEDELIGRNSSIFWSERNPKEVVEQILPATLNGGWKGELFNKRKDGTEFPIYLSTSVIKNDSGEQIAVVGIVEDITESKRSELEHEVLNEITHAVTTTTNLNELLSLIHKSLGKVVYAENCFVALYDQKTKLFGFPYFVDKFDPIPEPFAMHKSCTTYIFRTGKPLLLTQELFDNLVEQNEVELVGTNAPSWVGVPLKTPERTIGVLVIQHYEEENVYSEGDVQFISSVGNQIALVIERKRAEEMIKESEKRFRNVVEEAAEVIFTTDNKGYFVYANPRAVKLSGYSLDELTKLKYIDLIEPEYKKIVSRNYFKQYLTKEALSTTEYPFQTKSGEIKWFNQNARLIIENEEVRGFYVIARDVTELRKAEEAIRMNEQKFRTIANYTHDWEAWRTPDETFSYISASCERISGHTVKEFMSNPDLLVQITHPDDRLMIIEHLRTSIHEDKSKDIELDFRILKPTGEIRWLGHSCTAVYGEDGKWLGRRESNRDITERKKAELIIQQQNNQLQELNATKDKFFSIIAHDLRSPFQGFLSMTEMLTENISEFSNEEIVTYLGELNKSTHNIYKLLQNLLDWAQLKKGSFDFTPAEVALSTTVSASIEQINKRAIQKGITLISNVSGNQKVFVDERMINSILSNLLSNAVKFTRNEGKVIIKAKSVSNSLVEISVEDSGIGMSDRTQNKLFKIDEKVGQKGTDGELSTGLGLLLCKEFVEKHGGKIWAESEEGKGSTFYFTVPDKN